MSTIPLLGVREFKNGVSTIPLLGVREFKNGVSTIPLLGVRVRLDTRFEANISEYEANIYSLRSE